MYVLTIGKPSDMYDSTNFDWGLTLKLRYSDSEASSSSSNKSRYLRAQERQSKRQSVAGRSGRGKALT